MIHVEQLSFTFPKSTTPLFSNLGLAMKPGEKLALTGPSGIGKTTLIQLLAGLTEPTQGTIRYGDHPFFPGTDGDISRFRNQHIGVVFQDYNLLKDLTVAENLSLRCLISGQKPQHEKHLELLKTVDMDGHLNKKVKNLSGGQQQRVAAVRAMITHPDIILADEPTGNLDDATAALVIDLLVTKNPEATVIVATHDPRVLSHFEKIIDFNSLKEYT